MKRKLLLVSLISITLFTIIWLFYYLFVLSPVTKSKSSLMDAKNLATDMKLINSQNLLGFKELSGINPSHPSYNDLIKASLESIKKTNDDFTNLNNKFLKTKFGGNKETKDFLQSEYKPSFNTILSEYANSNTLKNNLTIQYQTNFESLEKLIIYNPYTDFSNLNPENDEDREVILTKTQNATEGMNKVSIEIQKLNTPLKEQLLANLTTSIDLLNEVSTAVESQDASLASDNLNAFLTSYNEVFKLADQILRQSFNSEEVKKAESQQEQINSKLEELINKIEEKQLSLIKN